MQRSKNAIIAIFVVATAALSGPSADAAVTWPAGQLLPSLSANATNQDLMNLSINDLNYNPVTGFSHATGHSDSAGGVTGWLCQVNIDQPNLYMLYGPYDSSLPAGSNVATFNILIDNNTADNNPQVEIDVRDNNTGNLLASQVITRQQWTSANSYQSFSLPYTSPAIGHALEFRVYWYGGAYIKVSNVSIERSSQTENAVLFSSLKGLVNSAQPRIWTYDGDQGEYTWLSNLGLSYTTPSSNWSLLSKYLNSVKGLVVYDDNQLDTINLATTIAAQKQAIVAPPLLLSQLQAAPYNLPILVDLRNQFTSNTAVYQYLYNNYWANAPHRILMGLNPTAQFGNSREYAAAVGSAVVWLDPRVSAQQTILNNFLSSMGPGTCYLGWWPDEVSGITDSATYGVATCASDWSSNLSNFSGTSRTVNVKGIPAMPAIQNKIYVAFIMSDGDNLQYLEHFRLQQWNDPKRGQVPIGWTESPAMLDVMPGVLNYYYNSATANDCLLSGPSGYGYTYPNDWANTTALNNFISTTNNYCNRAGLRIVTVWNTINGGINANVGQAYATYAPTLLGLTAENADAPLNIYGGIIPMPSFPLTATYCPTEATIESQISSASSGWSGSSPLFLIIQAQPWGGLTPSNFVDVVNTLNSNYVVVRPDTIFQMIRSRNNLPINPTNPSKISNGAYYIKSVQSGLQLNAAANTQSTLVVLNTASQTGLEEWNIAPSGNGYSIVNTLSGLALDGGSNAQGTHPQLWVSNGTPDQQWNFFPTGSGYSILSVQSGLALDGGSNAPGVNPQFYPSNSTPDQQWTLTL